MSKSLLTILVLAVALTPILIGCSGGGDEADTGAPTTPGKTTADPNKAPSMDNAGTNAPATPL